MGWPKDAYVGQKVVRFRGPPTRIRIDGVVLPPLGETVTISWIGVCYTGVMFDFIEYPQTENDMWHRGTKATEFKPLEERPTDISIFTAMLGPKQKETLDA